MKFDNEFIKYGFCTYWIWWNQWIFMCLGILGQQVTSNDPYGVVLLQCLNRNTIGTEDIGPCITQKLSTITIEAKTTAAYHQNPSLLTPKTHIEFNPNSTQNYWWCKWNLCSSLNSDPSKYTNVEQNKTSENVTGTTNCEDRAKRIAIDERCFF